MDARRPGNRADLESLGLPAGRSRLYRIARDLESGVWPDRAELAFLVEALKRSAAGVDPKRALGLLRRGRLGQTPKEWERQYAIANAVQEARDRLGNRDDAIEEVAAKRHKSFATVETYYKLHGAEVRAIRALEARAVGETATAIASMERDRRATDAVVSSLERDRKRVNDLVSRVREKRQKK